MKVDVQTEIILDKPVEQVFDYAINPDHAPEWYINIKSSEWRSEPPLVKGSKIAFTAKFLGRELAYVYEIVDLIPNQKLVMRTADGPFLMETTYTFEPLENGSTRMTLRNRGNPTGFSGLFAPIMARMMRKANEKDLAKIKDILESMPNS